MTDQGEQITYAAAGVDVEAGDKAVELMKADVRRATRPEVLGGLGGFAGMFDASALARMDRPVLATSTDGVGTKVAIAQALDIHDTIGFDLVGMVVDDIVVCGAEPLFMTDYIATGKVVPERIAAIVGGIARACEQAGVALIGGETAEHPGLLEPDEYDVAGAATGVVEHAAVLGPQRVRPGDVVLGLASSGLHSQRLLARAQGRRAGGVDPRPARRRVRPHSRRGCSSPPASTPATLLDLIGTAGLDVHALSHVTGGGLAANLARVLPDDVFARVDRATWTPPAVFRRFRGSVGCRRPTSSATLNRASASSPMLPADQRRARRRDPGPQRHHAPGRWARSRPSRPRRVEDGVEVVRGAKGVDGGAVQVVGSHPA